MDAEDVSQNVLLRVCESIHSLHEPKAFMAWLGSIVVNETRRYIAKLAKRGTIISIDDCAEGLVEDNLDRLPGEGVESRDVSRGVMGIVSNLPVRQREAVILRYFDDLNVSEVAQAMSIPHQSVSRYLDLARKKLRIEFEKQPQMM